MTVNYTTNLALGQPVTGTESGTWGDDVNNAVTSYLDIAIAGGLAVTVTTADVTLTLTQGTSVATNIGSTTAQYAILNVSGAMTAARNLIVPSSSRIYLINNNTTGGFALTVKGSATSGVTLVNGEKAHVFWNGTDYAKMSNASGGAGVFSSITNTGLTSGRVVYSSAGGLETDSANLTFNGTTLTANTIGAFTLSGTIAGGGNQINNVIIGTTTPLAGSFSSLTDSGNLTFTGTGNRITGDFTNATNASRVSFQTSTANSSTFVNFIPSGTGSRADLRLFSSSDPDNASNLIAGISVAGEARFNSSFVGTGTYLPMTFHTSGTEKLRIAADATGTYTFGGTAPRITGDFSNATVASRVMFQSSTVNGGTTFEVIPNGTSTVASLNVSNSSSDPANTSFGSVGITAANTDVRIQSSIRGTGTYLPMTFYTGGSEAMRIAVDAGGIRAVGIGYTTLTSVGDNGLAVLGKVGIGTSSPAATLHSYKNTNNGTIGVAAILDAGTQNPSVAGGGIVMNFLTNTGATYFGAVGGYTDGTNYVTGLWGGAAASGAPALIVNSSGNVGIGTSSPGTKLQAVGIIKSGATGTNGEFNLARTSDGLSVGKITLTESTEIMNYNNLLGSGVHSFTINTVERMRIDSSGNVGIGTSSPATRLTVANSTTGIPIFRLSGFNSTDNSNYSVIQFYNEDGSGQGPNIAASIKALTASNTDASGGQLTFSTSTGLGTSGTEATEKMRIDSSGNLLLGRQNSDGYRLNIAGTTQILSGHQFTYSGVAAASLTVTSGGAMAFGLDGSTGGTERMRIDSSGNVGIGTSSPTGISTYPTLDIRGSAGGGLRYGSSTVNGYLYADTSGAQLGTVTSSPVIFYTNGTDRMRIDSSGNLLVGTTSAAGKATFTETGNQNTLIAENAQFDYYTISSHNKATSGDNRFVVFGTEASFTARGSITYNRAGGLTAYNTGSDYRAKDIYGPVVDSGALIDSVPVYRGKMKGATQERPMFIAHETPAYAHTGVKDAVDADGNPVYQQMDASALIPVMWAEIQSLRKRLADAGIS